MNPMSYGTLYIYIYIYIFFFYLGLVYGFFGFEVPCSPQHPHFSGKAFRANLSLISRESRVVCVPFRAYIIFSLCVINNGLYYLWGSLL